ncbi:YciI family protein [Cellulomonas sp. URHE0023]|uniref:YciI family protein n=1 Tax=Cellulomonas sp. URHE0023 TaxID=1380354 RepID=UPI000489DCF0|nr:YciI family protein [Cellulomonas sp. URHE0023]
MAAKWMVLLYGNEGFWSSATQEIADRIMEEHRAYGAACAERGYTLLGGEELDFSSKAFSTRRSPGGAVQVTEGPYSETVEYLGGFYIVETDDPRGLAQLTGEILVTDGGGGVEIRPVVLHP